MTETNIDQIENTNNPQVPVEDGPPEKIYDCCITTIGLHAANNPMMVCENCKQIVKVFTSEPAFKNYIKFCDGRGRTFRGGETSKYRVVTFHIYDTFNK